MPFRGNLQQVNDARAKRENPLTGAVSTYAQKFAAVRAASRVYGVKAVRAASASAPGIASVESHLVVTP